MRHSSNIHILFIQPDIIQAQSLNIVPVKIKIDFSLFFWYLKSHTGNNMFFQYANVV